MYHIVFLELDSEFLTATEFPGSGKSTMITAAIPRSFSFYYTSKYSLNSQHYALVLAFFPSLFLST